MSNRGLLITAVILLAALLAVMTIQTNSKRADLEDASNPHVVKLENEP